MDPVMLIASVLERTEIDQQDVIGTVWLRKLVRPPVRIAFLADPLDSLDGFTLQALPLICRVCREHLGEYL